MSNISYFCERCSKEIKHIRNHHFVTENGIKKIICDRCIIKRGIDNSGFGDLFSGDIFKGLNLPDRLGEKMQEEEKMDHVPTSSSSSELSQQMIEKQLEEKMKKINDDMALLNQEIKGETPIETPVEEPTITVEEAMAGLDTLVGLPRVKKEIEDLIKRLEGQKRLEEKSAIQIENPTLHMLFAGGSGTGKREVAKKLKDVLYASGYIAKNKLVETDRSELIGEHMGATPAKVKAKVKEALGGILYVHEAHLLTGGSGQDYGKEAIDTLVKEMETHRKDLVVILSVIPSEMEQLYRTNANLSSCIANVFNFQDYTPKQLTEMAEKMLVERGYDCRDVVEEIEVAIKKSAKNGMVDGNGRWVRNFVEKVVQEHLIRISEEEPEHYEILTKEDVQKSYLNDLSQEQEGLDVIKKEALDKLQGLIGLGELKEEVKRIMNFFAVQKKKFDQGLSTSKPTMHMVFSGPPGTGKTTVAKIMAQFLKGAGILTNGHLKEVSRGDLVGAHVGETAIKVKKVILESMGGFLFIDEAYALDGGPQDSFGQEAIDTLIKEMEENRDNLIVILAGYEKDMEGLLNRNAGFQSRIAYRFDFPNYSVEEMLQISDISLKANHLECNEETKKFMEEEFARISEENFGVIDGNGRWVRNFVDKLQIAQSNRIITEDSDDLTTFTKTDVEEALKYMEN